MKSRNPVVYHLYRALALICTASILWSIPFTAPPEAYAAMLTLVERAQEQVEAQVAVPLSGRGQVILDGPMGSRINTYNGNLYYKHVALYSAALLPLQFGLSYNSLQSNGLLSVAGYGWHLTHDMSYREEGSEVVVAWGDGREVRYTAQGDGSFASPLGVADVLSQPEAGRYLLVASDQIVYHFDSARHSRVTRIEAPQWASARVRVRHRWPPDGHERFLRAPD